MTTLPTDVRDPCWSDILRSPALFWATWGGVGLAKIAPGTLGSLAALPVIIPLLYGAPWPVVALAGIALLWVGIWAGNYAGQYWGKPDHGAIVIDEALGQLVTLMVPWYYVSNIDSPVLFFSAGFVLFRIFDITKLWPASWCDRAVKNGLGVMLDDVAAGCWAALVLLLLAHFGVF